MLAKVLDCVLEAADEICLVMAASRRREVMGVFFVFSLTMARRNSL